MTSYQFGEKDPLLSSKNYLAGTAKKVLARRADVFSLMRKNSILSKEDIEKIAKKHQISKSSITADITLYRSLLTLLKIPENFTLPKTIMARKALELFCKDSPIFLAKEEKSVVNEAKKSPLLSESNSTMSPTPPLPANPLICEKENLPAQPPIQIVFSSIASKLEFVKKTMDDLQEENQGLKKELERLTNQNLSLQMRLSEKETELEEVELLTNQLCAGEATREKKAILILGKASNGLKIVESTNFKNDIEEVKRTGILARAVKEINKYFSSYDKAYPSYRVRQILHGELSGLNMITIMKRYRLVYEIASGKIILQNFFHRKELRRVINGAISPILEEG
ncbi:MAG TPA: hypothetical protein GX706_01515 [Candidatus Moranbacteria bacterium]|nr:hypothetical protein [Candidatus Moranbacteria bacterium]